MTGPLEETELETERAERPVLRRTFEVQAVAVEGRTVDVRIVPFGEVARVADPPKYEPYNEEWMPGVFDHQLSAANRVHANYEHGPGIANVVGHGLTMRAVPGDGYHASFKIHKTSAGDTALELLADGALPGVSLEARPVRSVRTADGVVQRVKAHLSGIAFCRTPAFAGAQVLAMREEPDLVIDDTLLPLDMDPDMIERCRQRGIQLPERYKAHPAVTGTPAEAGTPEDGTRLTDQAEATESSEV
jgi:HK97 family phage prohead protease